MKTFWIRASTALFFTAFMVGGIFWNQYSFLVLMSLILVGSLHEYFSITRPEKKNEPEFWVGNLVFLAVYLLSFFTAVRIEVLLGVLAFLLFARELFSTYQPFARIQRNILPIFWILLPLILTNRLFLEKGSWFLFAVFGLIWIYDSGCYIVGSLIGRTKLIERISPKKTVEGAMGGVFFTLLISAFVDQIPALGVLSRIEWVVLALVIVVSATFGDLIESVFKREHQIKDSGSIMPGHGGFLDRFDAYFFAVPFVVLALWAFEFVRKGGFF